MDPDLAFVTGLTLCVLTLPAMVGAALERRVPVAALMVALGGGGLVAWAVVARPDVYRLATVPDAYVRVVAAWLH